MDQSLEEIRRAYETSPFFRYIGAKIVWLEKGAVEMEIPINENLLNSQGTVHGGIYATLIDNIISIKMRSISRLPVVTVNLNVQYMAPAMKGKLIGKAQVTQKGHRLMMGEGSVFDEAGNLLAKGTATFKIVRD